MQVTAYGVQPMRNDRQPVKRFGAVYGAQRFINVLTRAGNVSMFSDRCISVLSSHLCPSRASGLFPGGCPTWGLRSSSAPHAPPVSSLSWSRSCMRSADHFAPHSVLSIFVLVPHIDASIFINAVLGHPQSMFFLLCETQVSYPHQNL
jgi:hypothetical protein